jgi:hypothetical protein
MVKISNKYLHIDLGYLYILFLEDTVISGTTNDLYNPDDTKVLTSGSITDIIRKINETVDEVKKIINDTKKKKTE